jgi:hypothetical protein
MKILHYIRRFLLIPGYEKKILIKGLFIAFVSKIIISILPVKYYLNYINLRPRSVLHNDLNSSIVKSHRILKKIIRIFPFAKNCFIKAITLKYILNEFGIHSKCVFSVKKDSFNLICAHAYIALDTKFTFFRDPEFYDVYAF